MYTACLMKQQTAIYHPTECSNTRFIKESFRSHLIKEYFICTVLYNVYTVYKIMQSKNNKLLIFTYSYTAKLLELKKKSIFFFIFEEATEAMSECK